MDCPAEGIVYTVISPESALEQRIYVEEDIQVLGGINAIELELEHCSYWFAYTGKILGQRGPAGVGFDASAFGQLQTPAENAWKIGRCNPAFRGSELQRHVFRAAFLAIERALDSWKEEDDETIDAFSLRELKLNKHALMSIVLCLNVLGRAHHVTEVTIIKYWYDTSWAGPSCPIELAVAEFSITIPLEFRWSAGETLVTADVMITSRC